MDAGFRSPDKTISISMTSANGRTRFNELPVQQQERFCSVSRQMIRLTEGSAVPIIFGPPPRIGDDINSATGCVLRLRSGSFLVTAAHVLAGYKTRLAAGEELVWQVGHLPFNPLSRAAWTDD